MLVQIQVQFMGQETVGIDFGFHLWRRHISMREKAIANVGLSLNIVGNDWSQDHKIKF